MQFLFFSRRFKRWLFFALLALLSFPSIVYGDETMAVGNQRVESLLADKAGRPFESFEGWRIEHIQTQPDRIDFHFRHETHGDLTARLLPRNEDDAAFGRTERFNLLYLGQSKGEARGVAIRRLMERLTERIESNDDGSITLVAKATKKTENTPKKKRNWRERKNLMGAPLWLDEGLWTFIDFAERSLALLLLVVFFIGLAFLFREIVQNVKTMKRRRRALFLFAFSMGGVIRLIAPHTLVMAMGGYKLIEQVPHLERLYRYGPGAPQLYHLLYQLLPLNAGQTLLWTNTLAAILTLPIASLFLARWFGRERLAPVFLLLFALHPILIKDSLSESNLVLAVFFLMAGLYHWQAWVTKPEKLRLFFAASALTLAILTRPFFLFFAPLALLLFELFRAKNEWATLSREKKPLLIAIGIAAILLVPHALFLIVFQSIVAAQSNAAGFSSILSGFFEFFISAKNLFLRPDFTPFILPLLLIPAIALKGDPPKKTLLAPLLMALFTFAFYAVDSPPPSLPRLQAPIAYWLTALSGVGLLKLYEHQSRIFWRAGVVMVLLALTPLALATPFQTLWTPTNETEEHRMLERAAESLPTDRPITLAWLSHNDEPITPAVFRSYPEYLFNEGTHAVRIIGLSELVAMLEASTLTPDDTYVYLGNRCYALKPDWRLRRAREGEVLDKEAAKADYVHPLCSRIREIAKLKPVAVEQIKNRGIDADFFWYPPKQKLTFGLYQIVGLK